MKRKNLPVLTPEQKSNFHNFMIAVQIASNGLLPQSIVYFMEEALDVSTKIRLIKKYQTNLITAREVAVVIYAAGCEIDYGSTEPVNNYIKRKLL